MPFTVILYKSHRQFIFVHTSVETVTINLTAVTRPMSKLSALLLSRWKLHSGDCI